MLTTPLNHLILCALIALMTCTVAMATESTEATDWPWFGGPNGDASYRQPDGSQPATSAEHMRLIWESEAMVGATGLSRQQTPSGGAATPIIYRDRIYLYYFTPNLEFGIDRTPPTRKVPNEYGSWSHLYRVIDNAIVTDQRVLCIDAHTGKTLWERHFPATGLMQNGHKDGLNNMTMAAADGRVYAFGSGRYVYALDAETGALLWRSRNSNWLSFQQKLANQVAIQDQFKRSRDGNHYIIPVEDVIVTGGNDNGSSLNAFDVATGERRWTVHGWTGGRSMPDIWQHNGRSYLVCSRLGGMCLIDPKTGEKLWTLTEGIAGASAATSVQGDYLFINTGEADKGSESTSGRMGCFRLSLEGPTLLWEAPEEHGYPTAKNAGAFVHDGIVWMRNLNHLHGYDLNTGEVEWSQRLWGADKGKGPITDKDLNDDTAINIRINNLLYLVEDSQHLSYPIAVVDLDQRKVVGRFTIHNPGLSYSSMMLPIPWKDKLILRRSYGRISCLSFSQPTIKPDLQAEFIEGIQVVATNEEAVFTVALKNKAPLSEVRFIINGEDAGTDTEAPFELRKAFAQPGTHLVQATAVDAAGNTATTSQRLLKVVEWEVRLLPEKVHMELGQRRRFIPVVYDANSGHLLPQRFQAVQMGQFLDSAWSTPLGQITKQHIADWHARATFKATGGTVNNGPGQNPKAPFNESGSYTAQEAGEQSISVSYSHAGVTKEATAMIKVRAEGERLSQHVFHQAPLGTYRVNKGSIRQMLLALDSGLDPSKVVWKLVEGPANQRKRVMLALVSLGLVGLS